MTDNHVEALVGAVNRILTERLDDVRKEIQTRVGDLQREVHKTNLAMAKLEIEVKLRACPSPGSCLTIAPKIEEVERRLKPLEDRVQQEAGARKMLVILMAICSAFGAAVGAKAVKVLDAVVPAQESKAAN